jgi:hypothetical protein
MLAIPSRRAALDWGAFVRISSAPVQRIVRQDFGIGSDPTRTVTVLVVQCVYQPLRSLIYRGANKFQYSTADSDRKISSSNGYCFDR